jgi:tRNA modification GTPase
MSSFNRDDNLVGLMTAPGRGAIAVVKVRGPAAKTAIAENFRSRRRVTSLPLGGHAWGHWLHEDGFEEIIVVRTGEHEFEICTHGGVLASDSVCRQLAERGFQRIDWRRAVVGSAFDWRGSAETALVEAWTLKAANFLLHNTTALPAEIDRVVASLEHGQSDEAESTLSQLLRSCPLGWRLRRGWTIVIAGRSNVGKSTLLNRLLGYDRSIVVDRPGTTRDVVREVAAIDGWPVRLADTAGMRATANSLERRGIQRGRGAAESADLVILVSDLSTPWTRLDEELFRSFPGALLLHNKWDLAVGETARPPGLHVCLRENESVEQVVNAIAARLFANLPALRAVLTDLEQMERCEAARSCVRQGATTRAIQELRRPVTADHTRLGAKDDSDKSDATL